MKPAEHYQYKPVVLPRLESMPPIEKSKNDFQAGRTELMKALKFDPQDLEANRAGFVSSNQTKRLKRNFVKIIAFLWFGALVFVVFTLLNMATDLAPFLAVMTPFPVLFVILAILDFRHVALMLPTQCVKWMHGILKKRRHFELGRYSQWHYKINIQGKEFEVSKDVYEAFIEGEIYTIYYLPITDTLLSAEHVSGPIPMPAATPPQTSNPLTPPSVHA